MEDGDGNHRTDVINQSEAIFSNHLIVSEILASSSARDLRRWRRVNKIFNAMTCEILNLRQNPVGKFDESSGVITTFLDTMDDRLEHRLPYSAYKLVSISRINSEVLGRFGTDLTNQIRKLDISFFEPVRQNSDGNLSPNEATDYDWSNGKAKTLLLLSQFPNLAELDLHYNEDHEGTFLNAEDLDILPHIFPLLVVFRMNHRGPFDFPFEDNGQVNDPIPVNFVTEIAKRAPQLKFLQMYRSSRKLSPSLRSLPAILSELSSPPTLWVGTNFWLCGDGLTRYPTHLIFLRNLRDRGLNQLSNLHITLSSPSPGVMVEFNQFLEFQAQALENLYILVLGTVDPSLTDPLILPSMPKLGDFRLEIFDWPLTQIRPNPLTISHFPLFNEFNFEHNLTLNPPLCRMVFSGSYF